MPISPPQIATNFPVREHNFSGNFIARSNDGHYLSGNDFSNVFNTLGGRDYLRGFGGEDRLYSGSGTDIVEGGDGNDTVSGDAGDDWIYGDYT